MNFSAAISTCLSKYATFSGRASRSEYWWFYLFITLMSWAASVVGSMTGNGDWLGSLISLAFMIPLITAGSRRLHDVGRSGWWQLLVFTVVGTLLLIFWYASKGEEVANEYGDYVAPG